MISTDLGLNSLADQRYYHFVLLRNTGGLSLSAYWNKIGDVYDSSKPPVKLSEGFDLQYRKLRSTKSFASGEVAFALSEKGRGQPPFFYDLFALKLEMRGTSYLAFGFPFASLAIEILDELMAGQRPFRGGSLQGVNIANLVKVMERSLEPRNTEFEAHIVGLQFVVTDDNSLTALKLGGDNPLGAEIYKSFLQKKVSQGRFLPDQCVLACQRARREAQSHGFRGMRSRLHVDAWGNFKFYAHIGCANFQLLPDALNQLRTSGCLENVSGNPLRKREQEEAE